MLSCLQYGDVFPGPDKLCSMPPLPHTSYWRTACCSFLAEISSLVGNHRFNAHIHHTVVCCFTLCSRKFDRLFRFFDHLSHNFREAKQRVWTVSKSATFFATESVNSVPFEMRGAKVRIFGKEKCEIIANYSATGTKVTVRFRLSLSLSLSLSASAPHA